MARSLRLTVPRRCDHFTHNPPPDDERGARAGVTLGGDQGADGDPGLSAVPQAAVHQRDDEGGGGGCGLAASAAERCGHPAALWETRSVSACWVFFGG